jgi:hypothetical protein
VNSTFANILASLPGTGMAVAIMYFADHTPAMQLAGFAAMFFVIQLLIAYAGQYFRKKKL